MANTEVNDSIPMPALDGFMDLGQGELCSQSSINMSLKFAPTDQTKSVELLDKEGKWAIKKDAPVMLLIEYMPKEACSINLWITHKKTGHENCTGESTYNSLKT